MLNKLWCHAHLTFSQSDYLIQIVDINSQTSWQIVQIQIRWLLQIYTVCKGRVYSGSAGLWLRYMAAVKAQISLEIQTVNSLQHSSLYSMVSDISWLKDVSKQKCINYLWSFLLYRKQHNYWTALRFFVITGKTVVKFVSTYQVYTLKKDQQRTYLMMFMRSFPLIFFIKAYVVGIHLNCIDNSNGYTQHMPL